MNAGYAVAGLNKLFFMEALKSNSTQNGKRKPVVQNGEGNWRLYYDTVAETNNVLQKTGW
jgi:hypothetical protein